MKNESIKGPAYGFVDGWRVHNIHSIHVRWTARRHWVEPKCGWLLAARQLNFKHQVRHATRSATIPDQIFVPIAGQRILKAWKGRVAFF